MLRLKCLSVSEHLYLKKKAKKAKKKHKNLDLSIAPRIRINVLYNKNYFTTYCISGLGFIHLFLYLFNCETNVYAFVRTEDRKPTSEL